MRPLRQGGGPPRAGTAGPSKDGNARQDEAGQEVGQGIGQGIGAAARGGATSQHRTAARRIVSIYLPLLPIELWLAHALRRSEDIPDDLPLALSVEGRHGPVVHGANRAARLAGVQIGARVTDMRAICPALRVEEARPDLEAATLDRLMLWARRWGPWSAADGCDGLVVDTTGAAHLHGGEAAMLADMQARFALAGLTARVAVAPSRGAAWGLARHGAERAVCTGLRDLDPLPVAALRLSGDTLLLLRRLGLRTIGDLAAVPRLSMMRRFGRAAPGDNPLVRLDQAMGRLAEPVSSPEPPPRFHATARLAEPVQDPSDWLPGLTRELCARLAAEAQGCRRLRLSVFRVDGERRDLSVAMAVPTRDPDHLLRLWGDRLERLDPGFGFDLITLTAEAVEPLAAAQDRLDGGADATLELARLVDRLGARFGAAAITRPEPRESHVPERAEQATIALEENGRRTAPEPRKKARRATARRRAADAAECDPRGAEDAAAQAGGAEAAASPAAVVANPATSPATSPASSPAASLVAADPVPAPAPPSPTRTARPLRLFQPPEEIRVLYAIPEGPPAQFVWRRQTLRVARHAGPERIAPEWWLDRPGTRLRDYFCVEDPTGRRLWIYREGLAHDGRGGAPRWFLHGVFA